jgi:hypothetical protein
MPSEVIAAHAGDSIRNANNSRVGQTTAHWVFGYFSTGDTNASH